MNKTIFTALASAVFLAGQAFAVPIVYQGELDEGGLPFVTGNVTAGGVPGCGVCGLGGPGSLDFWKLIIGGTEPHEVTITGHRTDDQLDLLFVLFSGLLPELPEPLLDFSYRDDKRIWRDGLPPYLAVIVFADDEIDMAPLPWGDPKATLMLNPGVYTLAVSGGTGSGNVVDGGYLISLGEPPLLSVDTPEPSTYLMMGTGLAALLAAARRKRTS